RNTEEKIRESEKTMNVALSASPVGICRLNNRVLEWGNKTFFNMFGYDLEELSQHSIRILYNNDVECERVGKILYTYGFCESKMRTKSGKIIEVGMRSANISGNTYIVTFMDLTQLKKREHEVVLARKRYEELINNLPICIYRNTPGSAGSFIEANPAIVELLEAGTKENLLTKNVSDFYANQSDRIGVSEKIMKQGYVKDEKVQLKTMTGKVFTASITAILKKDQDDRTYFDGAITDVTEKEEAQRLLRLAYDSLKAKETELQSTIQKLEQMNQDLRDAEKKVVQSEKLASIGELSAGIAHEINNPVGFISSNLVTLSGYIDDISKVMRAFESLEKAIDEKNYEKAQNVRAEILDLESSLDMKYVLSDLENLVRESTQGVDRIKHIVADLKTFSHKDDGIKAQCDLNKVMDAIINIVWNEIKYKAELKKDYGDIPMVECNMQQIGQVLMNLLINAAQAIEGKGVIYIRTYHADDFVFVEVSDTGKGIPQELRDKIFHPFFTTKEIGKGTGLGLSISMDIVKKHYGRIDVVSKEGKGAVFTVCLPVKSAAKRG
ncbi:MAG TPA: ATP-binding protein, partial [Candidatus Omnitrophota bacterium]|nr:ATP-binding protein [Candidatus Omnitrophota bacterium]